MFVGYRPRNDQHAKPTVPKADDRGKLEIRIG